MSVLKLQSNDGQVFEMDTEAAKVCGTIKNMLEDLGDWGEEEDDDPIPLPNMNSVIVKKVVQWCSHHKDGPPTHTPSEAQDVQEDIETNQENLLSWDSDFLNVDQGTLFELILAANYLDIKSLLNAACKSVAYMIKGKSTEEIRAIFNIKNDFTLTEIEQCRKDAGWCEEKRR